MKIVKLTLILMMGGLMVLDNFSADSAERPLHVLYLGPLDDGGGRRGGGFGGPRTNYVYLPGQTLAPDAIYFDHLTSATNLTSDYLKHFDAVVQVLPDTELSSDQKKMLDTFKGAGNPLIKHAERPSDGSLREAVLSQVSAKAKSAWEALLASRPALQRQPGEVPNYERRPEPVKYQLPLSPRDSIKYTQVPADFELQLFVSEPDVVKPIYIRSEEHTSELQ